MPYSIYRTLTFLILLAALLVPFETRSVCAQEQNNEPPQEVETREFEGFILAVATVAEREYEVKLSYQGNTLVDEESWIVDPMGSVEILEDFPRQGCRTMNFSIFSGGAHCCTIMYMITLDGENTHVTEVHLENSSMELIDIDGDGQWEANVIDWSFAYYFLDEDHNLCYACSPGFARYLVYTDQGWRANAPGEFPQIYMDTIATQYNEHDAAHAIRLAYYTLMAGGGQDKARNTLEELLPPEWQDVVDTLFADIVEAVEGYAPMRVLELE
ncbi:MAG: hypothetical protein D6E12_02595 [Desulfovibrio sp.]|nr:MAG: hypothetical protein D6E12_02595 [Desulfovibrio sp.]